MDIISRRRTKRVESEKGDERGVRDGVCGARGGKAVFSF